MRDIPDKALTKIKDPEERQKIEDMRFGLQNMPAGTISLEGRRKIAKEAKLETYQPKYTDYEAIESRKGLNDVLDSVLLVDEEVFLDELMQFV